MSYHDRIRRAAIKKSQALWAAGAVSAVALTTLSLQAEAQDNRGSAEGSQVSVLAEVIVTAQRRSENLQDVPISVQAFDEALIDRTGLQDLHDLALFAPGVEVTSAQPGNAILIIRGLAPIGGAQTAALYIDDIPVTGGVGGSSFASSPEPLINDSARVEVLKGPQGTLYGDSAMGGAIKFVSNRPDPAAFSGKVTLESAATEGGSGSYSGSAMLNVPLAADKLALRVAGSYRDEGGFVDNMDPRTQQRNASNVDDYRAVAARAALGFTPAESWSIVLAHLYQRGETNDRPYSTATEPGGPQPSYMRSDYLRRYEKQTFQPEEVEDEVNLSTLTIDKEFSAGFNLTSITGYFQRDINETTDINPFVVGILEGSPLGSAFDQSLSTNYTTGKTDQLTQEIRLASKDSDARFAWTIGGYYEKQDHEGGQDVFASPLTQNLEAQFGPGTTLQTFIPYALPSDQLYTGRSESTTTQYALFGEASFKLTDALKVTAGARYFEMEIEVFARNDGFFNGGPSERGLGPEKTDSINPRVVVEYKFSADNMIYLSATKGFRAGSLNGNVPTNVCGEDLADLGLTEAPAISGPDSLWNYELGSKNQFRDGRLRVNAAIYQMLWDDIQLSVTLPTCNFSFTDNVGKARVNGAELALDTEVTEGLTIGVLGNYLDSEVTDVVPNTPFEEGDELPYAPGYSYSGYLEFTRQFGASTTGYIRADYLWHGDAVRDASSNSSQPNFKYEAWDNANLVIGAVWEDWEARLFVRNVLNDDNAIDYTDFWGQWRIAHLRPRTIGITATKRF